MIVLYNYVFKTCFYDKLLHARDIFIHDTVHIFFTYVYLLENFFDNLENIRSEIIVVHFAHFQAFRLSVDGTPYPQSTLAH